MPETTWKCRRCGSTERYKNGHCAPCGRANRRARYASDPEKSNAWRKANPEKVRAADRARHAANPNPRNARAKAWRAANPEKNAAISRAWDLANPEKKSAYYRVYRRRKDTRQAQADILRAAATIL